MSQRIKINKHLTTYQSFNEVQNALNNDTTNVVDITKTYLQNIAENQHLNAFNEVYSDEALEQAVANNTRQMPSETNRN